MADNAATGGPTLKPYIRLKPTAAGVFFAAITFTIVLGGINYNSALACGLGYLLGALALVSLVHARRNLAGIELTGAFAEPVFAGEPLLFQIRFANRAGPERIALRLELAPRRRRRGTRATAPLEGALFELPQGGGTSAALPLPTTVRGPLRCPKLRLRSTFPLGLFAAYVDLEPAATGLVYPPPEGTLPLPEGLAGEAPGTRQAGPGIDDFAGLRDYHPGDPPRAIAWKTLAHGERLAVKRFVADAAEGVLLHWDQVANLPAIETRLRQLCRWLLDAERRDLATGLVIPGTRIAPDRGPEHLAACLRALAEFGA